MLPELLGHDQDLSLRMLQLSVGRLEIRGALAKAPIGEIAKVAPGVGIQSALGPAGLLNALGGAVVSGELGKDLRY